MALWGLLRPASTVPMQLPGPESLWAEWKLPTLSSSATPHIFKESKGPTLTTLAAELSQVSEAPPLLTRYCMSSSNQLSFFF